MDSYPCPFCGAPANLASGCPGCGRPPHPDAAEVIRLDAEIPALAVRAEQARQAYADAASTLRQAQERRAAAAARVRAAVRAETAAAPPAVPASGPEAAPAHAEASTRTVQNTLFILGGLLLGTAAIVFTAVAWAAFGQGGRAAILAGVTALALAAPVLALRRGLVATAETFAAVGLLLVLLDGYAAWYVDLFGVRDGSARGYAGVVCAVTAAVALGYGAATRLVGPRFAALAAAQPVLPLLLAPREPDLVVSSLVFAAVAGMDIAVVWWRRGRPGQAEVAVRVLAWVAYGCALFVSGVCALAALVAADETAAAARGGGALVAGALLFVAGAVVAREAMTQAAAGATLVLALAMAGGRFVAVAWESLAGVLTAAVVAGLAMAVAAAARYLPPVVRLGPQIAAFAVTGVAGVVAVGAALVASAGTIAQALPAFRADLSAASGPYDWQLPVALGLLTAGLLALLPRPARVDAAVAAALPLVLSVPPSFGLPWWGAPALEIAAAGAAAVAAVWAASPAGALVRAAVAGLLAGHAILAGLARPGATAAVLAALLVLGVAVAGLAHLASDGDDQPAHRRAVGGAGLAVGLLAWPGAVAAALTAWRVEPWWVARATVAAGAVLLLALVAVERRWPAYRWYAFAAAVAAAFPAPLWAVTGATEEPPGVYAAIALLLIAAAVAVVRTDTGAVAGGLAAVLPGLWLAAALAPPLWAVLGAPYGWLGSVWSGRPDGVGLSPGGGTPAVRWPDAVALVLLAAAVAVPVAVRAGPRIPSHRPGPARPSVLAAGPVLTAGPVLAVALPVALAAAGAPWPSVATVSLLLGLGVATAAALITVRPGAVAVAVPVSMLLAGAGLAGALPTRATTIAALGLTVAAGVAAGAAGRTLAVRIAGWLTATGAGVTLAVAAGLAADLPARTAAFGALAVAAAALAGGTALRRWRPAESVALQAAAQAGAATALLLTVGSIRYAAAVCTLWGVVLALRALWPGEAPSHRRSYVAAAAGVELLAWWLLMAARQVPVLEAYTLPAAAVALLAGWLALRSRPQLSSWVAYGPALAAAFLPTVAWVLVSDQDGLRRLLLGTGGLAAVLAGAAWRRQAPVVLGGAVLMIVALHELMLVWDLLPRWIPLAAAGLLLVGLAMTLERRRRDLTRVRRAVGRMT
ncbi:MAG TPA: hypothetical protein VFR67_10810 [Pilimelia sp.]|nr:hypothetical protein [Pilimelia sp.]